MLNSRCNSSSSGISTTSGGTRGNFISYLVVTVHSDHIIELTMKKIDISFPPRRNQTKLFQTGSNPRMSVVNEFSLINPTTPNIMGNVILDKTSASGRYNTNSRFLNPTGVFAKLKNNVSSNLEYYYTTVDDDASGAAAAAGTSTVALAMISTTMMRNFVTRGAIMLMMLLVVPSL